MELPRSKDDPAYDLARGIIELENAADGYKRADEYATGCPEEFAYGDPWIQEVLRRTAAGFVFRLAAVPIKALANRLKLAGISISPKSAETAWQNIHNENQLDLWIPKTIKEGLKHGDAYVWVWPDAGGGVAIHYKSPLTTRVIYDPNSAGRLPLYSIERWTEGTRRWAELGYRDKIEIWATKEQTDGSSIEHWELTDWEESHIDEDGNQYVDIVPAVQPNPYGRLLIKHFRTDMPYGVPVHFEAYGPQNAITEHILTEVASVRANGWPTRYGLVDPAGQLDTANEEIAWDDDANSNDVNPGQARRTGRRETTGPGRMEYLEGLMEVGQWAAAELMAMLEPVKPYINMMSVLTETPLYSFDPGGEQPSGTARQIADEPLTSHTEALQAYGTSFFREVVELAMLILEQAVTAVEPKWHPANIATSAEDWEVVKQKQDCGMPIDVALIEAGRDPEEVKKWAEEQQKVTATTAGIALLGAIGEAIGKIGLGVTNNLVSERTAQEIIAQILEQIAPGITVEIPDPSPEIEIDTKTGLPVGLNPNQNQDPPPKKGPKA